MSRPRKLTPELKQTIRSLRLKGWGITELARAFNCCGATISNTCHDLIKIRARKGREVKSPTQMQPTDLGIKPAVLESCIRPLTPFEKMTGRRERIKVDVSPD